MKVERITKIGKPLGEEMNFEIWQHHADDMKSLAVCLKKFVLQLILKPFFTLCSAELFNNGFLAW